MTGNVSVSFSGLSVLRIATDDGATCGILLDCGVHQKTTDDVDVVLVSQPDIDHMHGLIPLFACAENGGKEIEGAEAVVRRRPTLLLTNAAIPLATMAFYSMLLGATEVEHELTTEDVDRTFKRSTGLRYREEHLVVSSESLTVTATPYNSGRMVGGAIWRIKVNDVHDIIYAIDFNHKKEMILSGCSMMDLGLGSVRPGLVVTSAGSSGSQRASSPSALCDTVLQTLRNDGNVLIPVDASGRVLEILMILNTMWEEKRLTYPLLFVGPVVKATLEFARCQLEWMNEDLVKGLGHQQVDNPLALKRVTLCSTEKEALRIMQLNRGPAVVLAVSDSLEDGPSRNFFARWAGNRRNAVIVLDPKRGSLAERILEGTGRSKLKMTVSSRIPLQGKELKDYMENKATEKSEKVAVEEMAERERAKVKRDNVKVIETKRDRDLSLAAAAAVAAINADAIEEDGDEDGDDTECLIEGFELDSASAFPMFPDEDDMERTLQTDEYGDVVDLSKLDPNSDLALSHALASEAAAERAPSDDEEDVPTKIERKEVSLQVQARVEHIHLDGRSDAQSIETMLTQMAPRSCVIVEGSREAKANLAATLVRDLEGLKPNVFVPGDQETVAVDLGSARPVIFSDELYQSMVMHAIGDVEMGWIDAELAADNQLVPMKSSQKQGGIFIGDVKLSQLKRALAKSSIASEFHAGGLYCQGDILVKRTDRGLTIEGQISDQYYAIREIVYGQYHIC